MPTLQLRVQMNYYFKNHNQNNPLQIRYLKNIPEIILKYLHLYFVVKKKVRFFVA
jgi:hypothetical protein